MQHLTFIYLYLGLELHHILFYAATILVVIVLTATILICVNILFKLKTFRNKTIHIVPNQAIGSSSLKTIGIKKFEQKLYELSQNKPEMSCNENVV